MKKLIAIILLIAVACVFSGCAGCVACNGCNKTAFLDGIQKFDEAIIRFPDGTVLRGEVSRWNDYEGDQIQVEIDGVWYLVHSNNIVLIAYHNGGK